MDHQVSSIPSLSSSLSNINLNDMSSETPKKMLTLKSSDGEMFLVEESVMLQSETIKHMIEKEDRRCADNAIIPLKVSGQILSKVIEYCNKHHHVHDVEKGTPNNDYEDSLKAWDADFLPVDTGFLCDLMFAATYLGIKSLHGLATTRLINTFLDDDNMEEEEAEAEADYMKDYCMSLSQGRQL